MPLDPRRFRPTGLSVLGAFVFLAVVSVGARQWPAGTPVSEAEKRYVAPSATERVADGLRKVTVSGSYNNKFSATNDRPTVTVSNPYMDPAKPLFAKAESLQCAPDGGLIVSGRAGFDKDARPLGTGFWRISIDGAITPLQTRSYDAYALTSRTTCEAPFGKSKVAPKKFSVMRDGRIVFAGDASLQTIAPDGFVARMAGSPRDCQNDNTSGISGYADGKSAVSLFDSPERPVEDTDGNIWVADQKGCALRKIAKDGEVTTVLSAKVLCDESVSREDRPLLDNLTWDPVHGELVTGGARTVARPVHNLYTTIWRIKPSGEFRRVLFSRKLGVNPSKSNLDGINALGVDGRGRIHVVSLLMLFDRRGWDALQLLRVDDATGTVTPLTGTRIPNGTFLRDWPMDGPAETAYLQYTRDLCFAPDGTLYLNDDMLIRRLDLKGQMTTWAF